MSLEKELDYFLNIENEAHGFNSKLPGKSGCGASLTGN